MTKLPFGGQVPAHTTSLDAGISLDDGARLSAESISAKLRANLRYAIGAVFGRWSSTSVQGDAEPIRSELFSIERLEQHAESLAATQRATTKPTTDRRLETRLRDNQRALRTAYQATVVAVREERAITPAADWLVNNFHIV